VDADTILLPLSTTVVALLVLLYDVNVCLDIKTLYQHPYLVDSIKYLFSASTTLHDAPFVVLPHFALFVVDVVHVCHPIPDVADQVY
jgi:hypothetical protein